MQAPGAKLSFGRADAVRRVALPADDIDVPLGGAPGG